MLTYHYFISNISDSTTYAHFLFNAFDTDHNGAVSFEVSLKFLVCVCVCVCFNNALTLDTLKGI